MRNYKQTEEKTKRDDRVRYYVIKLKNIVSKNELFELIEKNGITSKSTAKRVVKSVFDWGKGETELFLATYTPVKSDSKAIDAVLGLNASKVSSEVIEEPKSDNEQFEEELKDGDVIEFESKKYKFVETGKFTSDDCQKCDLFAKHIIDEEVCICSNYSYNVMGYFEDVEVKQEEEKSTECDTEAAHIINELAAKNQELQKELQKYKNDLNTVLDDRRKLECLLSDNTNAIELNPKYDSLYKVLLAAYNQASNGKGKERHQLNNEEYFEDQKICEIARRLSIDYNLGQAVKKIYESKRLTDGGDIAELYGAINYIAAAIIVKQEEKC